MKKILFVLAVILALSVPATAQQYLTTTTLSASITASQTQFQLASATNVQVGGALYIDQEFMPILAVSSTTVTVSRTNKPAAHAASAQVFVATAALKPLTMLTSTAAKRTGQCSTSTVSVRSTALASIAALPIIDIDTGNIYDCRHNGVGGAWVWNVINVQKFNSVDGSTWAQ